MGWRPCHPASPVGVAASPHFWLTVQIYYKIDINTSTPKPKHTFERPETDIPDIPVVRCVIFIG